MLRALLAGALLTGVARPAYPTADASALRHTYSSLGERLEHSPFQRGLHVDSTQGDGRLKGDIYARVEHRFDELVTALDTPAHWCQLMMLHPNIRYCRVESEGARPKLVVRVARRFDQPLDDTQAVDFDFHIGRSSAGYFDVRLQADRGPVGTRDYRIRLEAIPVEEGKTFMHLTYAYTYGFAAGMATRMYLATSGSDKRGFSVIGTGRDGAVQYVGGVRGAVERNAMRYYLAVDAFLDAMPARPGERFAQSLQYWLDAVGGFPQLREENPGSYYRAKVEVLDERA